MLDVAGMLHKMRRAFPTSIALIAVLSVAPPVGAQLDQDPRAERPEPPQTLDTLAQRFLSGYESLSPPGSATLGVGETHVVVQQTLAGMCYAVAAVTTDDVDIDIRIRTNGVLIAQDVRLDTYPVVQWCAASDSNAEIEFLSFGGASTIDYAVYGDDDTRNAAVGPLDELSNRVNAAVARSAPRWETVGPQWRNTFTRPEVRPMSVTTEPGFCYAIVAVGQASVEDIDLLLLDEDNFERARDFALDATPLVAYCPPAGETLTVHVALRAGRGVVAAQLLKHAR